MTPTVLPTSIQSLSKSGLLALRGLLIVAVSAALTACGGGGGGGGGTNVPPTARINASPICGAAPMAVSFDAGGSLDPDGGIASYSWTFGDGGTATGAAVSHTYNGSGTFTATLTVTDTEGARGSASVVITTVTTLPASVAVNGTISFERVPFLGARGDGLDYAGTYSAPAREVEVTLIRAADGAVLQTGVTNKLGQYSLAAPPNTNLFVRAKALSRPSAAQPATWNLRVLDNTRSNALYVLDGSAFYSCVVNQTRNLTATTGWGGGLSGVYNGPRAAAPFAVLDTLYSATQFVITEGDANVQFPALAAYWSEDNVPAEGDVALGQIGTTSYVLTGQDVPSGIYVLGDAGNDTDEFDQHVIAHEFQHYLEDVLSRSDTIGGQHFPTDRLDMRVAFSEGFANAFSGMVLEDPRYRDSLGPAQGDEFNFDMESDQSTVPGWYNEVSVQRIAWDLYDSVVDQPENNDADKLSIGYRPMYEVFIGQLRTGVPLASLFPFIVTLKQNLGSSYGALVDTLVEAERLDPNFGINSTGMTSYADNEDHSGVADMDEVFVLPIYTPIAVGGPSVKVCTTSELTAGTQFIRGSDDNQLGMRRVLKFSVSGVRDLQINVTCVAGSTDCPGDSTDPDLVLSQGAVVAVADSSAADTESLTVSAATGDYVLEVYDWELISGITASAGQDKSCLTVQIR